MDDIYQSAYTGEQIDAAIKRVLEETPGGDPGGSSDPPAVLISKRITSNGSYSAADDGVDGYSSVSVNVKVSGDVALPTLKTPTLILDNYNAVLTIDDSVNGEHTEQYSIYKGDSFVGTTNSKIIDLRSMMNFTGNTDVKVVASAEQFTDSSKSVTAWTQPRLISPTIEIASGSDFLVIKDWDPNTDKFKVYVNDELIVATSDTVVTLSEYIPNHTTTLEVSVVTTSKDPYYLDSTSIKGLWEYVISGTEGLAYTKYSDYAVCTGIGTATDADIVIAKIYDGVPVTSINTEAFRNNSKITSVHIPEGVTMIGNRAFYNCSNIVSVTFPSTLTLVNSYAFSGAPIKQIYISDIVSWCTANWAPNSSGTPRQYQLLGSNIDMYLNGRLLSELVIPGDVNSIRPGAFYGTQSITRVTISNGVGYIGDRAFQGCVNIKYPVYIPETVNSLGDHCFRECTNLPGVLNDSFSSEWYASTVDDCPSMQFIGINRNITTFRYGPGYVGTDVYYEGTEEEFNAIDDSDTYYSKATKHYNVDLSTLTFPELE